MVSQFDPKFPRSLHFRSNVYREAIQNHLIQRVLTTPTLMGKQSSQRQQQPQQPQAQGQGQPQHAQGQGQGQSLPHLSLPSIYLDLFHTSMAFGQLAHQPGDPVHFSPDYRYTTRGLPLPPSDTLR